VSMFEEMLAMMTPEEALAEFGTVEEKRAYIGKMRAEHGMNWENTIFPPGKTRRGVPWKPAPHWRMQFAGHGGNRNHAAKPTNSRDAKKHSRRH